MLELFQMACTSTWMCRASAPFKSSICSQVVAELLGNKPVHFQLESQIFNIQQTRAKVEDEPGLDTVGMRVILLADYACGLAFSY